ncbi:hypothetical protein EGW08_018782 [Elysia chlorotica]|uniref:Uncharacterized protein n=1 Tax=Elysia chlorotica TaxID=188477 RepID=A0A3S1H6Y2_ELYCH|nr:hypothetical protein EGW08_018782 [Elysia chlorotica]
MTLFFKVMNILNSACDCDNENDAPTPCSPHTPLLGVGGTCSGEGGGGDGGSVEGVGGCGEDTDGSGEGVGGSVDGMGGGAGEGIGDSGEGDGGSVVIMGPVKTRISSSGVPSPSRILLEKTGDMELSDRSYLSLTMEGRKGLRTFVLRFKPNLYPIRIVQGYHDSVSAGHIKLTSIQQGHHSDAHNTIHLSFPHGLEVVKGVKLSVRLHQAKPSVGRQYHKTKLSILVYLAQATQMPAEACDARIKGSHNPRQLDCELSTASALVWDHWSVAASKSLTERQACGVQWRAWIERPVRLFWRFGVFVF